MGKGDRKAKKPALDALDIKPIPRKKKNGRAREYNEGAKDPRKNTLSARCRQLGLSNTRPNRHMVSAQHFEEEIGKVMHLKCSRPEIADLWNVWAGWTAAERNYQMRILGGTGRSKGSSIVMVPDIMETDKSATVDIRTDEERDRDAVRRLMYWRGLLWHLDAQDSVTLHNVRRGTHGDLIANQRPTPKGLAAISALRKLASVARGHPQKW